MAHLHIGGVKVAKRHVIRFGAFAGAAMMTLDAGVAWAGGAEQIAHVAHLSGVTGAALAGIAAVVDMCIKEAGSVG